MGEGGAPGAEFPLVVPLAQRAPSPSVLSRRAGCGRTSLCGVRSAPLPALGKRGDSEVHITAKVPDHHQMLALRSSPSRVLLVPDPQERPPLLPPVQSWAVACPAVLTEPVSQRGGSQAPTLRQVFTGKQCWGWEGAGCLSRGRRSQCGPAPQALPAAGGPVCTHPPPRAPWEAAPAIGAPGTSGLRPWQAEVPPAGTQLCPLQKQSPHLRQPSPAGLPVPDPGAMADPNVCSLLSLGNLPSSQFFVAVSSSLH